MSPLRTTVRLLALATLVGCAADASDTASSQNEAITKKAPSSMTPLSANDPALGFTADFRAFLASNATYRGFDFPRRDLASGNGYGGRTEAGATVTHDPIVFVHGNSDQGVGGTYDGWDASITHALAHGYGPQEVYALTWGDANVALAAAQYHSRANLTRVRTFFQAVLAYTGASKIDVIAHSMGVTLSRKAILGGEASDALAGGDYDLGPSLAAHVDTLLGISGGNLGLTSCWSVGPTTPTCGATNGFYPGTRIGVGPVVGRSAFLDALLGQTGEASYVASIYTPTDEFLGAGALVWGENTATIPGENAQLKLAIDCTHFQSKTGTAAAQIAIVSKHTTAGASKGCL